MTNTALRKYLDLPPTVARRLLQVRRDARPLPASDSDRRAALIARLDAALAGMRRVSVSA